MTDGAPYATCRPCGAPLIPTFAFSGFEFYCLECGLLYDWFFGPKAAEPTPELAARYAALKAEWDEIAPSLIGGGAMLHDCITCRAKREPHLEHASADEIAAHQDALEKLRERARGLVE